MAVSSRNGYDAYKQTEISTANQGKLIVMLYDGAIRFLGIAIENMNPRTYDTVNTNIIKAQDILTELMISLNTQEGGEVAANLFNLYAYMKKRLLEANIQKDAGQVEEVIKMLKDLKNAWDEVAGKEGARQEAPRQNIRAEGASFSIQG